MRRGVVVLPPAGMAGWTDGKLRERSDAGVVSSRMAPVLGLGLLGLVGFCSEERRECSPWLARMESNCSC